VFVEAGFCYNDFGRVCFCWDDACLCVGRVFVFGGVCVVCLFVLSKLMVWCALCWGIVLPGCCSAFVE